MTQKSKRCEYRGCNKILKDDFEQWNLGVATYCLKHYDIKLKQHEKQLAKENVK